MKNKFAQMLTLVNKIDRNRIQLAWFTFMVLGAIIMRSPSDGGVGPF
jgi:hypothetical protein